MNDMRAGFVLHKTWQVFFTSSRLLSISDLRTKEEELFYVSHSLKADWDDSLRFDKLRIHLIDFDQLI